MVSNFRHKIDCAPKILIIKVNNMKLKEIESNFFYWLSNKTLYSRKKWTFGCFLHQMIDFWGFTIIITNTSAHNLTVISATIFLKLAISSMPLWDRTRVSARGWSVSSLRLSIKSGYIGFLTALAMFYWEVRDVCDFPSWHRCVQV